MAIGGRVAAIANQHDLDAFLDGPLDGPRARLQCCAHVSLGLLSALTDRLPASPALVLSVGSGSGLLEELLLRYDGGRALPSPTTRPHHERVILDDVSADRVSAVDHSGDHGPGPRAPSASFPALNLYGVEVASCTNRYLCGERLLRVPTTSSLHSDALLAEALLFVYPRDHRLIERYISTFSRGALQTIVWLGPTLERPEVEQILRAAFTTIEIVGRPAVPGYECLVVAHHPKTDRHMPRPEE